MPSYYPMLTIYPPPPKRVKLLKYLLWVSFRNIIENSEWKQYVSDQFIDSSSPKNETDKKKKRGRLLKNVPNNNALQEIL